MSNTANAGRHRPDGRTDCDVVVVGAGPIGLTLACALRHHGVSCRVFEQREEQSGASKAHNLWARSQELLESIGVRAPLAALSYPVTKIKVFIDRRPLAEQDLSRVASPYGAALYSGQDAIEETLAEALNARGGRVERGRPVVGVAQDEHGVDVRVSGAAGEEHVRCRYLVGADGVKGMVRKAIDLDFKMTKMPGRATRQIDAKLKWRRSTDTDQVWFFLYDTGIAGVMPVWKDLFRLFFLEDDRLVPDRDPTLEEMVTRAREVIGDPSFDMSDPVWFSHGHFQHGVAPAYARGRVFLAGDAGHASLPIGGQGMNAGLHDAVGLAWRLAMVLAGSADASLLDSYAHERQRASAELDVQQAKGFDREMYRSRAADAVLKLAADLVPNLTSKVFGGDDLSQLEVAYRDSPLSEDHFSSLNLTRSGAPRSGDRAPDAPVIARDGRTVGLMAHLRNPDGRTWGWCLLCFDGGEAEVGDAFEPTMSAIGGWTWVRPCFVLAHPASTCGDGATVCLYDLDGAAHAAYGLAGPPALVLVRPDGHIAFRGTADKPQRLRDYCHRIAGGEADRAA